MKYQILVKENIVMIGNEAIEKDCSMFVDEFVFCEINDDTRWVECDPFVGRGDLDDWDEVLEFIKNAENSLTEELILREEVLSQNTLEEEEIILTEEEIAEQEKFKIENEFKQAKADALNSITVTTTNGNTFDGNETARVNMTSAILSSEVIDKTEATWKLADNTSAVVTIDELKEALALSIQEVGRIVMVTSIEEL